MNLVYRRAYTIIKIFFILAGTLLGQVDTAAVSLESLLSEALRNNPGLKGIWHQVKSDSSAISVAGSLPDPMISFNLLNLPVNSFRLDQEPMTGKQIAVRQNFPFFGTLGLREAVKSDHARMSAEAYRETRNRLVRDTKLLYYEILYIDAGIRITDEKETLMKSLVDVIATKYSVGRGLQQDVLKSQVELAKIIEERIRFVRQREGVVARLNALLNRPENTPFGLTEEPLYQPESFNIEALHNFTLDQRPLLKKMQLLVSAKGEEIKLARKKYYPDMSAFAAYTQREELSNGGKGVDFLSAGLTLSIPLYAGSKQSADVESKISARDEAQFRFDDAKKRVLGALDETLAAIERNRELIDVYRSGILPQARQSLESAIIGYQTDKVDFITLLNNYLTLFKFELMERKIFSNYFKEQAKLDFISGKFRIN